MIDTMINNFIINLNTVEILGIVATLFVLVSIAQTKTLRLRIFNLIGSIIFVVYGMLIGSLSIWLLNSVCAILNAVRIVKFCRNIKQDFNEP